ncbi:MAG TPA: hypothetical protein VJ111_16375, partial [Chitinophagaceae bacterium]|nr:hypothetical protein [Chitinophagaceae bacterium]
STNAGGLKEIMIPGEIGYMADIGDIAAMSQHALNILKDDDVLKVFKTNAAAHAKKYDISKIIPVYEKLYERFL